jgi:diguanylate cyclase (GGDEF)-like protein/PAS domain S-box-containing protein
MDCPEAGSTPDENSNVPFPETARLEALRSFDILDTLPEKDYDDLTQLAAAICRAPISLITLIDENRQWFKSKVGLEMDETPLSLSFCRYALAKPDEVMVIPDTRDDARFRDHPAATGEPHVRFYAGAPLVSSEGFALGTLCVIDNVPRRFDESQQRMLQVLARQVVTQLELRRVLARANRDAAQQRKVHAEMRSMVIEIHDLYDNAPVGYHSLDAEGVIQRINQTELNWLGYTHEEVVGKMHLTDITAPAYRDGFEPDYNEFKRSDKKQTSIELELQRKDGSTFFCFLNASAVRDSDGNLLSTRSSVVDISELRRTTLAMRESEARFKAFMDHGPMVSFIKDENGRYLYANPMLLQRFEKTWDEFVGHRDEELWPREVYRAVRRSESAILKGGKVVSTEQSAPLPDGSTSFWLSFKFPLHNAEGRRLLGGVSIDITELKNKERQLADSQKRLEEAIARLEIIAVTNSLTGLKNRGALRERLSEEVQRARRYDLPLSLAMLDVDYFKSYNDSFGHPAGDEALRCVAQILQTHARPSDFSARYGGEEFVVVLNNTALPGALAHAERIRKAIQDEPWPQRGITASIGVASLSENIAGEDALLRAADEALYKAKHAGRNRVMQ